MDGNGVIWVLGTIALYIAIPGLVAFVVVYASRSRWRDFVAGRSVMYFMISLAMVAISGILVSVFGEHYPFRGLVRLVLYTSISFAVWRLVIVVLRIQNKPPRTAEEIRAALETLLLEEKTNFPDKPVGEVHLNENLDKESVIDPAVEPKEKA